MSEKVELDWQEWDVLATYLDEMEFGLIRRAVEFGHSADDSVQIAKAILKWVRQNEPEP